MPRWIRIAAKAYAVSLATLFLIVVEPILQSYFEKDTFLYALAKFTFWFIWIGSITLVYFFLQEYRRTREDIERQRKAVLSFAHERVDRWFVRSLVAERATPLVRYEASSAGELLASLYKSLFLLVEGTYEALESHFASKVDGERIEFVVSYMSHSMIDGGLTMVAWASSTHRSPRSLRQRPGNPQLYNKTVTAEVYAMPRPNAVIIDDTLKDDTYAEVYSGQRKHIRSTIIYPVLDESNEVIATLVCHCGTPNFFKEEDRKFWSEFVEIFARPAGLTTARIQQLVAQSKGVLTPPW
ncbi:MAG: GAF domain-containing protein [Phenylobacterium sp.]|nr:MAG: GAF domain-containing protein [Phenylobacterium sp.]